MNSPTLLLMVIPEHQHVATGYDTWTLEKLLSYNQVAVDSGTVPRWIPIANVADAKEGRLTMEMRLKALKR